MAALTISDRRRRIFGLALATGLFAAVHDVVVQPARHRTGLAALGEPNFVVPLAALGAIGILLFVTARAERVGAALTFATITLAAYVDAARIGAAGEHHAKHLPAIALGGWLVAQLARRPALAWDAAAGATGAAYFVSGISKLAGTGWGLVQNGALALLVAERAEPVGALGALRMALAQSPLLVSILAAATLTIELAGLAMIVPRFRPWFALAASAMHLGIAVSLGYVYVPWILTVLAVAQPPPTPKPSTDR